MGRGVGDKRARRRSEAVVSEALTVRHVSRAPELQVAGVEALPPSARETEHSSVYEIIEDVDCLICNPPAESPGY